MSDTNFNELDHTCGVSDEELSHRFKEAVRIENEIKKDFLLQNTILRKMLRM